jgi:hypothetical protein
MFTYETSQRLCLGFGKCHAPILAVTRNSSLPGLRLKFVNDMISAPDVRENSPTEGHPICRSCLIDLDG